MISPLSRTAATTGEIPLSELQGPPVRPHRRRNWFWIVVGAPALALVALILLFRWTTTGSPLVIAMVGVTPFFGIPLLFGALSSVFSRSTSMRAVAGVLSAAYLITMSPVDAVIGCGGRDAPGSVTVYSANVLFGQGRPGDVADSILAADADVFVLQEASFPFLDGLAADPRLAEYEHRSNQLTWESPRTVIWSRLPILDHEVEPFVVSELITVTVAGPTGEFLITGLHTLAPISRSNVGPWRQQFEQLGNIDTATPRLIAGDFNATTDHKPFRTLQSSGWTDVHDEAGCGFDATWPVDQGLPIAVMRLDHVLATDHFEILDLEFGDPGGSDHKPLIATVRLG